jgi:hypothetical protein
MVNKNAKKIGLGKSGYQYWLNLTWILSPHFGKN